MSDQEAGLVRQGESELAPSEAKFSKWAEDRLHRLSRANVEERKRIAEELRAEMRTAVECLVTGERSLFEAMCVVEIERVYHDMGYRSTNEWVQAEVVPLIESKRKIRKLKAAAREYVRLREWFGEAKPQWGILHLLDAETERQSHGKGLLSRDEYKELSREVAAGTVTQKELQRRLTEARAAKGTGRLRDTPRAAIDGRPPSNGARDTQSAPSAALATLEAVVVSEAPEPTEAPQATAEPEALEGRLAEVCDLATVLQAKAEPLALLGLDKWEGIDSTTLDSASQRLEDAAAVIGGLSQVLAVAKSMGAASSSLEQVDADKELARLEEQVKSRRVA